jgi:putative hydroxymethylpyrimidine transport system permease protein
MKKSENTGSKYQAALFFLILVILIQIITMKLEIPKYMLPSPTDVITALWEDRTVLFEHALVTFGEALAGFAAAVILGIILGGLLGYFRLLRNILYPLILISQMVPLIAVAPVILIWFGFGIMPKILIVLTVCIFPCILSFLDGLDNIDNELINLMKTMKANEVQIFFKLKLPASLQSLLSGLKISAVYSIMGAVIGEWLGAEKGLGIYMTRAISSFRTDALFASILIIIVLSLLVFKATEYAERKLIPWKNNKIQI